eukprot:scaffold3254_cov98-Cylindrotheca_fusiformis.AAC.2
MRTKWKDFEDAATMTTAAPLSHDLQTRNNHTHNLAVTRACKLGERILVGPGKFALRSKKSRLICGPWARVLCGAIGNVQKKSVLILASVSRQGQKEWVIFR